MFDDTTPSRHKYEVIWSLNFSPPSFAFSRKGVTDENEVTVFLIFNPLFFPMCASPRSSAFTLRLKYQEKINRLRSDISEFRAQCADLIPIGELTHRASHASSRISRVHDQIKSLTRAIATLEDGPSLSEPRVQPFISFLQTQIALLQSDWTRLATKIQAIHISDVNHANEEALHAIPFCAEESSIPIYLSFIEKWKQLNETYEIELWSQQELKLLQEIQSHEEESYSRLAATTDSAIFSFKEQIQEKKRELHKLQNQISQETVEIEKVNDEISQKMRKLKIVTDLLEAGEKSQLLSATASMFAMLQNPIETDERIQAALDSVIAIARVRADANQSLPPSPVPQRPIESTLQALQERVAARQLRTA
jgi:hypothetical protein